MKIHKYLCPTLCDVDCEETCHEVHSVTYKREHDPRDCPSVGPHSQTWATGLAYVYRIDA